MKSDNRGFIKGVIYLLVFALIIYVGISFTKPYYRYYAFKTKSQDIIHMPFTITILNEKIIQTAKELNVPIEKEKLSLVQSEHTIKLNTQWSEVVDFYGYYQKKLDFVLDLEAIR